MPEEPTLSPDDLSTDWPRGYVQVYTGDGKGKTTAAMGLALRAAGAGLPVLFAQFLKASGCAEIDALARWADRITVWRFGLKHFIRGEPAAEDVAAAQAGLAQCRKALVSGEYRVVILDEVNVAVHFGLLDEADLLALVDARPEPVELVLTGRRARQNVLARADLVTEMRLLKHYYDQGVQARRGIEL